LEEAYRMDHAGVDAMVMRSRACFTCKRRAKKLGEQKMAPLPEHRRGPTQPFWSTAVDLFRPLSISGSVNKRSTGKAWGVIFVCTLTSLAHVEIAETYSMESFLMAVRRFMALHGAPKRFQSDQGTQLVAASKHMATWDWTAVHEADEKVGAEWHIVPTGGQHYNGQAERLIGLLKRCLESTMVHRRFTLGELNTVVAEATQLVNRRPIAKNTGDLETSGPITPVFSGRMLCQKWVKMLQSVTVGDVVYLAEAENDDPTYRLGVVVEANPGEDGCVRTVSIRYTNPGKGPGLWSPPKITTRPIHKIAVIVPAGYVFEDDTGGGEASPRRPIRDLGTEKKPEAAGTLGGDPAEATDAGEPEEEELQPTGRKRHGRPKKSDKPATAGCEVGGEPQPASKKRPGRP
jgi:hypothetical protein